MGRRETMAKSGELADPLIPRAPPPSTLLPSFPRRRPRQCCASHRSASALLTLLLAVALVAAAVFVLWPSNPHLSVVRLRLDHVHVSTKPAVSLDVALGLKLKVQNRDFFALDYRSVVVSIGYRGRRLGSVSSDGGHVRARGVSYVDAELRLDGFQVFHDVFYLIEDVVRGSIPFDTVTEVQGLLHFLIFDIPIQGKISCAVLVNTANQTIVRQDCYPE